MDDPGNAFVDKDELHGWDYSLPEKVNRHKNGEYWLRKFFLMGSNAAGDIFLLNLTRGSWCRLARAGDRPIIELGDVLTLKWWHLCWKWGLLRAPLDLPFIWWELRKFGLKFNMSQSELTTVRRQLEQEE